MPTAGYLRQQASVCWKLSLVTQDEELCAFYAQLARQFEVQAQFVEAEPAGRVD